MESNEAQQVKVTKKQRCPFYGFHGIQNVFIYSKGN